MHRSQITDARGLLSYESQEVPESPFLDPFLLFFTFQLLVQFLQMFFENPAHDNRESASGDADAIRVPIGRTPIRRPDVPATAVTSMSSYHTDQRTTLTTLQRCRAAKIR